MFNQKSFNKFASTELSAVKSELDACNVMLTLWDTYEDVHQALLEKGQQYGDLMPRFRAIMEKEQQLSTPYDAYKAGTESGNATIKNAFFDYYKKICSDPESIKLFAERDGLFYQISGILESDDRRLLLNTYIELSRKYHSNYPEYFFGIGFCDNGKIKPHEFVSLSTYLLTLKGEGSESHAS